MFIPWYIILLFPLEFLRIFGGEFSGGGGGLNIGEFIYTFELFDTTYLGEGGTLSSKDIALSLRSFLNNSKIIIF